MVVLMEEFGGLSLKRKGADESELFAVGGDDRSGFPLSCRATKMRRLASPDGPAVRGVVGAAAEQQVDLPMGDADAAPSPPPGAGGEKERAMVLYGGAGAGPSDAAQSVTSFWPCASVRGGADWVRAMLRDADSRTVRELLAGAEEQSADLALALVPWVPPSPAEEAEPSAAGEAVDVCDSDGDGAAAMDVEEEGQAPVQQWTRQAFGGAGCGEGYVYRWPQHCMAPPQLPVVGQASPVTWSW